MIKIQPKPNRYKKVIVKRLRTLYARFTDTCSNLTVHGPRLLVRRDIPSIYRLIYLVVYILVWVAVVLTIRRYYRHYRDHALRFTTRTDYLQWSTALPATTVCESPDVDDIRLKARHRYPEEEDGVIDRYMLEVAFFDGTCFSCISGGLSQPAGPKDFQDITKAFRSNCETLFNTCFLNEKKLQCCQVFRPINTEYGTCYSSNNKHVAPRLHSTSRAVLDDVLEISFSRDVEVFLHSPEDIPFYNMEYDRRVTVAFGSSATLLFSITEIVNEPEVIHTHPEVRKCRFPSENLPDHKGYSLYSYSVCITQCRIAAQLDICGCVHHLSPPEYKDQFCDIEGLKCLTINRDKFRKLRVPGLNETGLDCACLPSCTEPDFNIISKELSEPQRDVLESRLKLVLNNKPYERVTRQVSRTPLDLVVAMGNCIGLFFGGSFLSLIEIFYYLCFKKWSYTNSFS